MPEHQKFVAIDPEVLLGLTLGIPDHLTAVSFFRSLRFLTLVTPSSRALIRDAAEKGDSIEANLMQQVLEDLEDSITVQPPLTDTYRQVIDIHADKIMEKDILPGGTKADALLLAEAAYFEADFLLTISRPLREAEADSLKVALLECGMGPIHILTPGTLSAYLQKEKLRHQEAMEATEAESP